MPQHAIDSALKRLAEYEADPVKAIDAQDVFEEEYPPGTPKRERMDAMLAANFERFGRKVRRRKNLERWLPRMFRRTASRRERTGR